MLIVPSSDDLEGFHEKLKDACTRLAKLKSAEVKRTDLIEDLAQLARTWLKLSQGLRMTGVCEARILDGYDGQMQDVLRGTTVRTRASAYRRKLGPVLNGFIDEVVVPLIKWEGSPTQVAARQVEEVFAGQLTAEESVYISEASRCTTVHCNRAALIMLWAAGISRLHRAIEKIGFNAYNAALAATVAKKGGPFNRVQQGSTISSLPELQRVRDSDILIVGMELWQYDLQVYQELDRLLGIRNAAAHPGMLEPTTIDIQHFALKVSKYIFAHISA